MLGRAVVVGRDRASPDVGAGADMGVPEVAHVMLLHAGLKPAVLDLGVVADPGSAPDGAAGSEVGERPDGDRIFHLGRLKHARPDRAIATDHGVDQLAA